MLARLNWSGRDCIFIAGCVDGGERDCLRKVGLMTVEVLVATMHQKSLDLATQMNIKGDAVIANQADRYSYSECTADDGACIRMITTAGRGLGRNRNQALLLSSGDICLLADDDEVLADDYMDTVENAFSELGTADVIIFNNDVVGSEQRTLRRIARVARARPWDSLGFGSTRIAFRRRSILRANIWFTMLFGSGAEYSAGEDSLFLVDCFRAGLKVFLHPGVVATVDMSRSTWFEGYTEKYFLDKGAFYEHLSSKFGWLMCLRFVIRHGRKFAGQWTWLQAYRLMRAGAKRYAIGVDGNV